jgi:hypothetical protein
VSGESSPSAKEVSAAAWPRSHEKLPKLKLPRDRRHVGVPERAHDLPAQRRDPHGVEVRVRLAQHSVDLGRRHPRKLAQRHPGRLPDVLDRSHPQLLVLDPHLLPVAERPLERLAVLRVRRPTAEASTARPETVSSWRIPSSPGM